MSTEVGVERKGVRVGVGERVTAEPLVYFKLVRPPNSSFLQVPPPDSRVETVNPDQMFPLFHYRWMVWGHGGEGNEGREILLVGNSSLGYLGPAALERLLSGSPWQHPMAGVEVEPNQGQQCRAAPLPGGVRGMVGGT